MKTFLCEALPCVNDALGMNEDGAINTWLLLGFFLQKQGGIGWVWKRLFLAWFCLIVQFFSLGLDCFGMFYMPVQEYSLYFRWIIIEMKHAERDAPLNAESLKK